ncbi:MAG: MBL fold metallo-hydrolase [Flavobacteriales bacterium]|nr:MAG: MBL fold metallo-hydrolase [Flavobacteriales bacterium]
MNLYPINAGNFKLDGGAMFGVVPKSLWQKTNPSDSNNLIDLTARCMLIESGSRLILVDAGMGDKQSEKFFSYYKPWGDDSLIRSINNAGFSIDEITDVFLTHLHFDHCGGATVLNNNNVSVPLFKNAKYWSNKNHWDWATSPNSREKASFLNENLIPIEESGQLCFLDVKSPGFNHYDELGFDVLFVDGHTEKQMIPKVSYSGKEVVFMADLLPTAGHIPLPYIMGYDVRPLTSLEEKRRFLNLAVKEGYCLFMEHDAHNQIITLKETEKGIRFGDSLSLKDL